MVGEIDDVVRMQVIVMVMTTTIIMMMGATQTHFAEAGSIICGGRWMEARHRHDEKRNCGGGDNDDGRRIDGGQRGELGGWWMG